MTSDKLREEFASRLIFMPQETKAQTVALIDSLVEVATRAADEKASKPTEFIKCPHDTRCGNHLAQPTDEKVRALMAAVNWFLTDNSDSGEVHAIQAMADALAQLEGGK